MPYLDISLKVLFVEIETASNFANYRLYKYDLFSKCWLFLILNFHFDFWEQLFSGISAEVPWYIVVRSYRPLMLHYKSRHISWKAFHKVGPKRHYYFTTWSSRKTFEDVSFFVEVASDSRCFHLYYEGPVYKRAKNVLQWRKK